MTAINSASNYDTLAAAKEDHESVVDLTRELVSIPSRGGIDPYDPVLGHLNDWLSQRGLHASTLRDGTGTTVGLACEIVGAQPGPRFVLDACLDTAPYGDEEAWTYPPTSATIVDGWLHGRGSADSKSGAAIFSHIAARVAPIAHQLHGTLVLLLDVDEHTGSFGGAKAYFQGPNAPTDVAGVMIGYPGTGKLVIGGRGVHRAQLHVHGKASHSGGSKPTPNAVEKAAQLITALTAVTLPSAGVSDFPLPAKLNVTAVHGGQGFSVTPDLCVINIDIRTTPAFGDQAAAELLQHHVTQIDDRWPGTRPTQIETGISWPAYALPPDSPLRAVLLEAAHVAGLDVEAKVAGPSNIGNYLAGLGIPATAGFGVDYIGLHGTDERIRLDSVTPVQSIYHAAALKLLGHSTL